MTYKTNTLPCVLPLPGPWHADAACLEHPEINFHPERGETHAPAKAVCAACLVRSECLAFALDTGQNHGIWGGTSGQERRILRRKCQPLGLVGGIDIVSGMHFFVPHAESNEQAEHVRDATIQFARETTGWQISERRIRRIDYVHEGQAYTSEIGQSDGRLGEEVLVILDSETYLVCTPDRGVLRGEPLLVGHDEVTSVVDFEQSGSLGQEPN